MRIRNLIRALTVAALIPGGLVLSSQPASASGDPACFVFQGEDDNYTVYSDGNGLPWPVEQIDYVSWTVDRSWDPFDDHYTMHGTNTILITGGWDGIRATIHKFNGVTIECRSI